MVSFIWANTDNLVDMGQNNKMTRERHALSEYLVYGTLVHMYRQLIYKFTGGSSASTKSCFNKLINVSNHISISGTNIT